MTFYVRVKTRVTSVTDHDERAIALPASMHSFGVSPKTSFGTQTKEMSNVTTTCHDDWQQGDFRNSF